MRKQNGNKSIHEGFLITVIVNGLIALADFFVGIFFLFKNGFVSIAQHYHGPLANPLNSLIAHAAAQNQNMGIWYFFSHSVVKLFLTWGLLTNRLWAYPLSIIFLSGFSVYQIYTLFYDFSLFTIVLLIVNVVTVFFIAREYRSL